jgi:hypothetical protein
MCSSMGMNCTNITVRCEHNCALPNCAFPFVIKVSCAAIPHCKVASVSFAVHYVFKCTRVLVRIDCPEYAYISCTYVSE